MEHTRQALIAAGLRNFANEAHWFDCTALFNVPTEVRSFGREMAAMNLFELPYPKTILWFSQIDEDNECALLLEKTEINGADWIKARAVLKFEEGKSGVLLPVFIDKATGNIGVPPETLKSDQGIAAYETTKTMLRWAAEFQGAMLSKDISTVRVGPSDRNVRRAREKGRDPGIVFHMLVLQPWLSKEVQQAAALGITRASPRLHWRRGHFRDLSGGKRERLVPVAPSIVGSKKDGMVLKDYRVQ